ncbi:hypothetical protein HHE02_07050 [Helicobacter heilmannii]|uniref:Uncharacterized protein n=1 Tax=Helicobacter heilmannii TaxID=35817 RepID=A0A0K2XJS4_HELHE|nr:hypothetical protein HHE014_07810 [Helicobacter heilmannii]CRF47416.1 hypothetical protein HHE02_07050 [Helicobacter heilmannii]CRF49685.1 hypothetical protein HHE03_13450 [Helicobacter heilmannii]CRF51177.1 hypothetical protein HHE06_10380 [Helicobacter heilmannii]CRI34071.1 hypothetical protein HHE01_09170 [Helicobacter heilmannii]
MGGDKEGEVTPPVPGWKTNRDALYLKNLYLSLKLYKSLKTYVIIL